MLFRTWCYPPLPRVLFPPYPIYPWGGFLKVLLRCPQAPFSLSKKYPFVSLPKEFVDFSFVSIDSVLSGFVTFVVVSFCFRVLWWRLFPAQYWGYISDTTLPRAVPGRLTMYLENRSCRKWQDYSEISVRNEYILFRRQRQAADQCHIAWYILYFFARGVRYLFITTKHLLANGDFIGQMFKLV